MVQFINRQEDPSVRIGQMLGGIAQAGVQGYNQGKELKLQEEDRKALEKKFDTTFSRNPDIFKEQVKELMKGERKKSELQFGLDLLDKSRNNRGSPSFQRDSSTTEPGEAPSARSQGGLDGYDYSLDDEQDEDFDPNAKYVLGMINPTLGNIRAREESEIRADKRARNKLKLEKDKIQRQEIIQRDQVNQPFITKTIDGFEAASQKENILNRLGELSESGDLSTPAMINFLDQVGLNREWLQNASNDQFQKLALDLLGGGTLQADYGARILASEFSTSLKRIPDLLQTDEGKRQIIENIKAFLAPAKLKYYQTQYYIDKAEREGTPLPRNLRAQVMRDIQPELDRIAEDFKKRNGRYKYAENTPLTQEIVDKYFYLSNGDMEKAAEMMKEDGLNVK